MFSLQETGCTWACELSLFEIRFFPVALTIADYLIEMQIVDRFCLDLLLDKYHISV